jgi:hypothetical protein
MPVRTSFRASAPAVDCLSLMDEAANRENGHPYQPAGDAPGMVTQDVDPPEAFRDRRRHGLDSAYLAGA